MIQLSAQRFLVVDRQGRQRPFSLDDVRENLQACFTTCGVTDAWPAEHISMILEEHLVRQQQEQTDAVAEAEIDTLICSVLTATGYGDVAAEYQRVCHLEPVDALSGRRTPWDERRLKTNLRLVLPLAEAELQELVHRVRGALQTLAISRVSDSFIRLLGAHLLQTAATGAREEQTDESPWLLTASDLAGFLEKRAGQLVSDGILQLHPVSRLLPRERVGLDLRQLATSMAPPPLTEIAFLPRLCSICRRVAPVMQQLHIEICNRKPHARFHPAHLIAQGVPVVVGRWLVPMNRRAASAFCQEVESVIRAEVIERVEFEVLLMFR